MAQTLPPTCRYAAEVHEHAWHFFNNVLPKVRQIRLQQPCCRVVVTTRVREPVSHYISMFRWSKIESRYGMLTNNTSELFERWAPPNLQAANLVWSSFNGFAEGTLRPSGNRKCSRSSSLDDSCLPVTIATSTGGAVIALESAWSSDQDEKHSPCEKSGALEQDFCGRASVAATKVQDGRERAVLGTGRRGRLHGEGYRGAGWLGLRL